MISSCQNLQAATELLHATSIMCQRPVRVGTVGVGVCHEPWKPPLNKWSLQITDPCFHGGLQPHEQAAWWDSSSQDVFWRISRMLCWCMAKDGAQQDLLCSLMRKSGLGMWGWWQPWMDCETLLTEWGGREAVCRLGFRRANFGKLVGGLPWEAARKCRWSGELSDPPGQHPCAQEWSIPALGDKSLAGDHLVRRAVHGGAPLLKGSG